MSLHVLPDLEQGTPEWHDQRRGMVTASVVSQLITANAPGAIDYDCPDCGSFANLPCISKRGGGAIKTYHDARTAVSVAKRKEAPPVLEVADNDTSNALTALLVAERITGFTDPTYISADMWRGIEDEPRARENYAEHYAPVETVGFMVRDDWGFKIGFSPDGLVGDDGLIEIKSRRQKNQLATVLADEVPAVNVAQIQCGLLVSGRAWCDYISYAGGMHLWRKRVYPDPRWFDIIVAAVEAFERTAEEMASAYFERVDGLPLTERVIEPEMVL